MTNEQPVTKLVEIASLNQAHFNPKHRTTERTLKRLWLSMEAYGQIEPICIDQNNNIINGHRRVAAAKYLKWKYIRAEVHEGTHAELYGESNCRRTSLHPRDFLYIYKKEPNAIPENLRVKYDECKADIGTTLLNELIRLDQGINTYKVAKRIANYCGIEAGTKEVLPWILRFHLPTQNIRQAVRDGIDPELIAVHIRKMKPLKLKVTVKS